MEMITTPPEEWIDWRSEVTLNISLGEVVTEVEGLLVTSACATIVQENVSINAKKALIILFMNKNLRYFGILSYLYHIQKCYLPDDQ